MAESITGGGVGAALTRVPGSSAYFLGSVTAYDNEVKQRVLGVSLGTLLNHGAVSAPVAEAMAVGVRRITGADVAVSTTGIAGPSGATRGEAGGSRLPRDLECAGESRTCGGSSRGAAASRSRSGRSSRRCGCSTGTSPVFRSTGRQRGVGGDRAGGPVRTERAALGESRA